MINVDFNDVELLDGFWKNRFELNATTSIYAVQKVFEESGRFDAIRFVQGKKVHEYYDSDVAKWIEAVAYLLAHDRQRFSDLEKFCDDLIDFMVKNQREDGYFNSYFLQVEPERIFTDRNFHELYCAGHLIEASVAYDKFTGKSKFLEFTKRMADNIDRVFRVEKSAKFTTCGHEEIELALFILYDYTKEEKYKTLAEFFVSSRGNNELDKNQTVLSPINIQEQVPAKELRRAEGHAVRATYFYSAMADMCRLTGDKDLKTACLSLYDDIVNRKMFVTGGVGSSRVGEAFTISYDLPNLSAYSESCAAIGLMFFAMRMNKLKIKSTYADTIERILYNGFLSSTSLDGKSFFYENPLEVCRKESGKEIHAPAHRKTILPIWHRKEVFDCSCCPPNINRFVASIENVIYSMTDDGVYVNQFIGSRFKNDILTLTTDYPNDGVVKITSSNYPYKKLFVRIPFWCDKFEFVQDGKTVTPTVKDGYAVIDTTCNVDLTYKLEITPKFIESNPHIRYNAGRVCLMRGPVVYAIEEVDNGADLNAISVVYNSPKFVQEFCDKCGLFTISCDGERVVCDKENSLYLGKYPRVKQRIKFIPYYAFANREESDMLVWVIKA